MVGARGFEPPTPCSQSRCATGLRHTPNDNSIAECSAPVNAIGPPGAAMCYAWRQTARGGLEEGAMFIHAGKPMQGQEQPARDAVAALPQLHVSGHPVVAHLLTRLRDETTDSAAFRRAMTDLSLFLAYEALAAMRPTATRVRTPLEETDGTTLSDRYAAVPILRAGLGMVDGFLALFPS